MRTKVAIVTGASSGIGRATAMGAAESGWDVVVNYRSDEKGARDVVRAIEARGREALAVAADVSDAGAVQLLVDATLRHFGRISLLVNNVGDVVRRVPFAECDEELWDRVQRVSLRSAYLCSRYVLPHMVSAAAGCIVNISSLAARTGGASSGAIPYAVAKAGLEALTVGLSREYASAGIRVNAVQAGIVETPLHRKTQFHPMYGRGDEFVGKVGATAPLKRAATAEEIADAVLFLASDQASYITGAVLVVTGGL